MSQTDVVEMPLGEPLLDVATVAVFLGVDKATVYRLAASAELAAIEVSPRTLRFRPGDVRAFLERRTRTPPQGGRVIKMLGREAPIGARRVVVPRSPTHGTTSAAPARNDTESVSSRTSRSGKPKRRRRFGHTDVRTWSSGRRTWEARWTCKKQRRVLSRSFDTQKEALDFLAELERRIMAGTYEVPPTLSGIDERLAIASTVTPTVADPSSIAPTLIAYAEHVIEKRFDAILSDGAMGVFRAALAAWKAWFGPRVGRRPRRLDQVTPSDWLDYRSWRATHRQSLYGPMTPIGPRTLNADLQCLIRVLNEAVIDGHLTENPLAGMKKLREPRRPRRYLTKAQIGALISNAQPPFKALLLAAIFTGARRGELLALRWRDIDVERGKIALFRSKVGNCDQIDLHPVLAAELQRVREERHPPADVREIHENFDVARRHVDRRHEVLQQCRA